MFELEARAVRLGASARDRDDAITQAGSLLVELGRVTTSYVDSMLRRERVFATHIGNGIAIPHGMREDGELVLQAGLAAVQFPDGVEWTPGRRVRLVFALAARDDDHTAALSRLTDIALHEETASRLAATRDADEFLDLLRLDEAMRRVPIERRIEHHRPSDSIQQREMRLPEERGLHARPASILASIARRFGAEVRVYHAGRGADGKSVASLLGLGARPGAVIRATARGEDAELVLAALNDAVQAGLKGRESFTSPFLTMVTPAPASPAADDAGYVGDTLTGIAAAPGTAAGMAQRVDEEEPREFPVTGEGVAVESKRLNDAIGTALAQIRELHNEAIAQFGPEKAAIIEAQAELLGDPGLLEEAVVHLGVGRSAEWAWREVTNAAADEIGSLPDPTLAARAADIRDMARRVLRVLSGGGARRIQPRHRRTVLVAEDLSPSETVGIDRRRIHALVTAGGGPNSHTAILARALGVPAVVGVGRAAAEIAEGATIIVDGDRGLVVTRPTIRDQAVAERRRTDHDAAAAVALALTYQPAHTLDGERVEVFAAATSIEEAEAALEAGAEGVGPARTELLFGGGDRMPSEEEQRAVYTRLVRAMNGLPLAIRTLDLDGEKRFTEFAGPYDPNPFLGERGLRLSFARPDLFGAQLRALASASREGPVRILLPMVSNLSELRKAREMIEAARKTAPGDNITVGVMIEVPAAAIMSDLFAAEVDFVEIGTGDLTQYVLAVDRRHPRLAHMADDLHPAVLRLIARTAEAAKRAHVKIGVCGGMASNARAAPLLIGLGIDEISAAPSNVPLVKQRVREVDAGRCRAVATRALDHAEADDVRTLLWAEGM